MRRFAMLTVAGLASLAAIPAMAAEIRVLTAGAFKSTLLAVSEGFERSSGHKLVVENDTVGGLVKRIDSGAAFDVTFLTAAAADQLAVKGLIAQGSVAKLARTGVGVAVKDGAPHPDISTVEGFKAALVAARKVAYIDPAAGGTSGIYFSGLLDRLGLADIVRAKAVLVPGGLVADRLVTGEADLAVHQISELKGVKGASLVGPLPREIQSETVYAGGVGARAEQPAAARALLDYLSGPVARAGFTEKGMEPAGN